MHTVRQSVRKKVSNEGLFKSTNEMKLLIMNAVQEKFLFTLPKEPMINPSLSTPATEHLRQKLTNPDHPLHGLTKHHHPQD